MKPPTPEILAGAVEGALNYPAAGDSAISETEAILIAVAQSVEQRDLHTARHCERLAFISVALGMALRLDRASLMALYRGGFLHDVGKIGIPDAILFKPARLTAEEWIVMRSHTLRGVEICRPVKALHIVLPLIRSHHERWDGSGYPDGLRRTQIPLLARVLQIADIYDALTSPRPYKRAFTVKQALRIIEKETERGWRDPHIVSLFLQIHPKVISRIDDLSLVPRGRFEAMRAALNQLEKTLAESAFNQYDFPDFSASARTSFPLPRSVPQPGSP
jgi:putative two-component system response regulator